MRLAVKSVRMKLWRFVGRMGVGHAWAAGVLAFGVAPHQVPAATYEVGTTQAYATPGHVPWESLVAGDIVRIHWQSEPYHDKWVICRQGSSNAPIVIQGVPSPNGTGTTSASRAI